MSNNQSNPTPRAHYTMRRRGGSSSSAPRPALRDEDIPFTQIPETPAEPSTQMSFEEFLSHPSRDRMERLHPERLNGAQWFGYSNNGITKSINRMLNTMVKHPYETFSTMPPEDKQLWFRQFAQDFTWDLEHHSRVRREFESLAATMYSRKMNEWKGKWKRNQLPKEFLHKPEIWRGLDNYWKEEKAEKVSKRQSTNRMSTRNGKGISTHNSGATSLLSREEQLFKETGVPPSHLDLVERIHTNKSSKEIQCQVARELVEKVKGLGEEYRMSQPEGEGGSSNEVPLEMWNEFVIQSTPKSKGRMFGVPKAYHASSSATSRFSADAQLRAELAERTTEIVTLQTELQTEKEANARRFEELVASNEATKAAMEAKLVAQQKILDEFMAEMRRDR